MRTNKVKTSRLLGKSRINLSLIALRVTSSFVTQSTLNAEIMGRVF
jgi:hypothetical protein